MSFGQSLVEWLDKSNLRPHELLSDLAAMNELFVIDGDSLLLETLKHEIVDWSGSAGEYLQVAYLVESFLNELLQRGATFRLTFFNIVQLGYYKGITLAKGNGNQKVRSIILHLGFKPRKVTFCEETRKKRFITRFLASTRIELVDGNFSNLQY